MNLVIIALSDAAIANPLTVDRHYAELPLLNRPLIEWQLERCKPSNAVVVCASDGLVRLAKHLGIAAVHASETKKIESLLHKADMILPGDLLPKNPIAGKRILVSAESDEERRCRNLLAQVGSPDFATLKVDAWRINYPWELLDANAGLLDETLTRVENHGATIDARALVQGPVAIGPGSRILAGSVIEGPVVIGANCTIGPMAHIRPHVSIANNCAVGKSEVVDAVLMEGVVSKHVAYLGHAVLCKEVNVGAMTVTADFRHDGKEHVTLVEKLKTPTGRRKLGAFIGDRVRLGIHTVIYPGRKIWPGRTTLLGQVVEKDIR